MTSTLFFDERSASKYAVKASIFAPTSPPRKFKYRAFISYSRVDEKDAAWLHRGLERYKIARDLVGRETSVGAVPDRFAPIFRDKDELSAGNSLRGSLEDALQQSAFLIVICSPAAAASRYVNEEIRYFKSLGRGDRIRCLIVDGEPHDPRRDCFPKALMEDLDDKGRFTPRTVDEPIAADIRPGKGDRDHAKLSLLAGLLGIGLNEFIQRDRQLQIAERRLWRAIAAGFVGLSIVASLAAVLAWHTSAKNEKMLAAALRTTNQLVGKAINTSAERGIPVSASVDLLHSVENLMIDLGTLQRTDPLRALLNTDELDYVTASMQLRLAESYGRLAKYYDQRKYAGTAVQAARMLATRYPADKRYRLELADAVFQHATSFQSAGEVGKAIPLYTECVALLQPFRTDPARASGGVVDTTPIVRLNQCHRQIAVALSQKDRVELPNSVRHAQISIDVALEGLVLAPSDQPLLRSLSEGYQIYGEMQRQSTFYDDALKALEKGLEVVEAQLGGPNEVEWRRSKGFLLSGKGDVLYYLGDIAGRKGDHNKAVQIYQQSYDLFVESSRIRKWFVDRDPSNVSVQSSYAYSFIQMGSAQERLKDYAKATEHFLDAVEVYEKRRETAPDSVSLSTGLVLAFNGMGNMELQRNRNREALAWFLKRVKIANEMEAREPTHFNIRSAQTAAQANTSVADTYLRLAEPANALPYATAAIEGRRRVATEYPDVESFWRLMAAALQFRSSVHEKLWALGSAIEDLGIAREVRGHALEKTPDDARWIREIISVDERLAALYFKSGQCEDGVAALQSSIDELLRLTAIETAPAEKTKLESRRNASLRLLESGHRCLISTVP